MTTIYKPEFEPISSIALKMNEISPQTPGFADQIIDNYEKKRR